MPPGSRTATRRRRATRPARRGACTRRSGGRALRRCGRPARPGRNDDHAAGVAHLAARELGLRVRVRPAAQARVAKTSPRRRVRPAPRPRPARWLEWRSMRSSSVRRPRSTRKQSNGPGTAPIAFCRNLSRSKRSSRDVASTPLTVSEWPARYLVALWKTMSAPSSSGCCDSGEANVLSTTRMGVPRRAPRCARAARAATAAMSISLSSGLAGVSSHTMRVFAA